MNIGTYYTEDKVYKQFYSEFLCLSPEDFDKKMFSYICTGRRDETLNGYAAPFSFCLFKTKESTLVSFSPKIKDKGMQFVDLADNAMNINGLKKLATEIFEKKVIHNIKFEYLRKTTYDKKNVVELKEFDYLKYESFFKKMHPNAKIIDKEGNWLHKYFQSLVKEELCFGMMIDGELVSVTDSPTIPFLSDKLAMIGINTLPEYRKRGYAKIAVSAMIDSILSQNKLPLWSCSHDNISSLKTALSVGFEKFGDSISIV